MDIAAIRKLVQRNGDRVILVEDGQPEVVVLSLQEYQHLIGVEQDEKRATKPSDTRFAGKSGGGWSGEEHAEEQEISRAPGRTHSTDARAVEQQVSVFLDDILAQEGMSAGAEEMQLEDLPVERY